MPSKLSVPEQPKTHYAKNYLSQAVIELRFPTLFEIEESRPPAELAKILRKEFPRHQPLNSVQVTSQALQRSKGHTFLSSNGAYVINVRSASISIETSAYDSFEEFFSRTKVMLKAIESIVDAESYTRVGMRYINEVPLDATDINSWINPVLVSPLVADELGDISEYNGALIGQCESGSYRLMYGLTKDKADSPYQFAIDIDFFNEDIEFKDTPALLQQMHVGLFSLFMWTLGKSAIEKLKA
jgi:uncharacterized protein (TIGR04255 family)